MNYDLQRFYKAQKFDYPVALNEIKNGQKESHWMWYIFPQLKELGYSSTAKYYGLTKMEEFLVYPEKVSKDIINIPVYEQAFSAGKGQELPDTAEILEYVAIPKSLMRFKDNICAAYVRGDSMEPTLFDDDIIIFDNFGYDGTDGIYAINYKGAGFVKRLQRDKDFVKIISDNKIYEPMFENGESEDFRIVGKIRYVIHKV